MSSGTRVKRNSPLAQFFAILEVRIEEGIIKRVLLCVR